MNYGQRAKELLLDLKRSDFIPPYNHEAVRATISEISLHFDEMSHVADVARRAASVDDKAPFEFRPSLLLHDEAIKRNKRCLLAYHVHRIEKLKRLRWDTAAALPSHVKSLLSEAEVDFYKEYDKLISRFNEGLGGLDLNSNFQPPEEDLIEVRVIKSGLGTIVTEYGEVLLELGTTHFLSRTDVEHLIRQGALQQIDGEEIS
jgi:GINS complex subunit 1